MNVTANIKSIGDKAYDIRERAADSLESAAESVRAAGSDAGRRLETTAAYVRPTCTRMSVFGGFRNRVRRHPIRSMAIATAFGLVAGFTCRR